MSKISAYAALTSPASGDVLPVVDISDTSMAGSGTTKKITVANLLAAGLDWINIVADYGADPTGTNDSSTAIQAAINAALAQATSQGDNLAMLAPTVYIPFGNYKIGTPLNFTAASTAAIRITGTWGSRLFSNSNSVFDFQTEYLEGLEIDHLTIDATGGHCFTNPAVKFSWFHHLYLRQNSPGFSVWNQTQASNQLQNTSFTDIKFWVFPDASVNTRSVPGWNIQCPSNDSFAECWFERVQGFNQANAGGFLDMTQYLFSGACTAASTAYASTIAFRDCSFHSCLGGAIWMQSVAHLVLDGVSIFDVFQRTSPATMALSSDLIKVSTFSGSSPSRGVELRGYTRAQAIHPVNNSAGDFSCTSDTTDVLIQGATPTYFSNTGGDGQINLNGAAKAVLVANDSTFTVLNTAADTVIVSPGSVTVGGSTLAGTETLAWTPADSGYLAWNFDIGSAVQGNTAVTNNTITLIRVNIRKAISVTNVLLYIINGGTGLVSSQNFAGLYNSSGTLIASTADQAASWASGGLKTMALTGGPYALTAGTFAWVAVLSNQSAGGTPTFLRGANQSGTGQNAGVTASAARWATNTTGTTLPGSITPGSNTTISAAFWTALS